MSNFLNKWFDISTFSLPAPAIMHIAPLGHVSALVNGIPVVFVVTKLVWKRVITGSLKKNAKVTLNK